MNQQAMPSAPSLRTSPVLGWNTSTPLTFTRISPARLSQNLDVRLAEDDEEVALAGVLEVVGHVQVGVHAGLEHGDAAELAELRGVGLVVEGAGDQHVEAGVAGLAGGGDQVGALDGAELGADEDGGALLRRRLPCSGPRRRRRSPGQGVSAVKVILSSLCACCTPAVLRFSRIICEKVCCVSRIAVACRADRSARRSHRRPARGAATGFRR